MYVLTPPQDLSLAKEYVVQLKVISNKMCCFANLREQCGIEGEYLTEVVYDMVCIYIHISYTCSTHFRCSPWGWGSGGWGV